MSEWIARILALPSYGLAGLGVALLYGLQSEIRFGARARSHRTGSSDRNSTLVVSLAAAVPVVGFVLAMKASSPSFSSWLPGWFSRAALPGVPLVPWVGVGVGLLGIALRLWAVLTLRERYTRTLLLQDSHPIERNGPYRWVRHPGYLGSLLCLNGVAVTSANLVVFMASLLTTIAAYAYRIKVEDEMLGSSLGPAYAGYRQQVGALVPFLRSRTHASQSRPDA